MIRADVPINPKLPSLEYVFLVLTFIFSPAFRQGFSSNRRHHLHEAVRIFFTDNDVANMIVLVPYKLTWVAFGHLLFRIPVKR